MVLACTTRSISIELAIGLSFSPIKRRCLESFGATLIGLEQLQAGQTPREVVEWHLANAESLGKSYFYTDQFNNPGCLAAHEQETGPEILAQLAAWPEVRSLTFVACAGTGAHLTGIARALKQGGYIVNVILVEPDGCDSRAGIFSEHRFEGMAVGVRPPLLDWALVNDIVHVDHNTMLATQNRFATYHGHYVGNTSAACLAVADTLRRPHDLRHQVLTIAYDHGLWYT